MARRRKSNPKKATKRRRRKGVGALGTGKIAAMLQPVFGAIASRFVKKFLKNADGTDKFFKGSSDLLPIGLGYMLAGRKNTEGLGLGMLAESASSFISTKTGLGRIMGNENNGNEDFEMLRLAQSMNGMNEYASNSVAGFNERVQNSTF